MGSKSYSKGISWIDDCRIPFVDGDNNTTRGQYENKVQVGIMADRPNIKFVGSFDDSAKQGRFPANLLVSDDMLNDGVYHKTGIASIPKGKKVYGRNSLLESKTEDYGGKFGALNEKGGSNSRYYDIDRWFDNLIDV